MAGTSSLTRSRAASWWPASVSMRTSASPDLSSAGARVSDTVSTAMRTGMNGREASILGIGGPLRIGPSIVSGRPAHVTYQGRKENDPPTRAWASRTLVPSLFFLTTSGEGLADANPTWGERGASSLPPRWGSRAGTGTHRTQEKRRGHTTEPADRWWGRHPAPAPLGARRGRARDRLRGARPIGSLMLRHNV